MGKDNGEKVRKGNEEAVRKRGKNPSNEGKPGRSREKGMGKAWK